MLHVKVQFGDCPPKQSRHTDIDSAMLNSRNHISECVHSTLSLSSASPYRFSPSYFAFSPIFGTMFPAQQEQIEIYSAEGNQILITADPERHVVSFGLAIVAAFLFSHGTVLIEIWFTYTDKMRPAQILIWTSILIVFLDLSIWFGSAGWGETDMLFKVLMLVALVVPMVDKGMRALLLLIIAIVGTLLIMHKIGEISLG